MTWLQGLSPSCWAFYPDVERKRPEILEAIGRTGTPVFLCERDNLLDRHRALAETLAAHWGPHVIGYSFKTNYLVAKARIFQDTGVWAEVVSGREYRLARELGFSGRSIIFNGPYKTDEDLSTAVTDGALVNINDRDELDRFLRIVSDAKSPVDAGVRLSGNLPKLGHSRFGFSMENREAADAVEKLLENRRVNLTAIHTHLYGDTDDANIYGQAARRFGEFAKAYIPDCQHRLRYIDMGGGFPAHGPKPKSRQVWNPRSIDVYIRVIADSLRPFFSEETSRPALVVEPGRYLTCDGIILVTRVVHVNQRQGKQVVNCNGSISMVPLTHYCPQVIRVYAADLEPRTGPPVTTVIYGSTCRENDILYEGEFPVTQRDDLLIHFAAGAYNSSLSPDFIFESPAMEII